MRELPCSSTDAGGTGCAEHYRPPASNIGYWADKISRNRERERQIDQALVSAGWTVIRVWEHETPDHAAPRRKQQPAAGMEKDQISATGNDAFTPAQHE